MNAASVASASPGVPPNPSIERPSTSKLRLLVLPLMSNVGRHESCHRGKQWKWQDLACRASCNSENALLVHLDEVFWKSGGFNEKRLLSEVAACFAEQERPQIAIGLLEGTSAFDSVCPVAQLAPATFRRLNAGGASHQALNATRSCASDDALVRAGR